MCSCQKYLYLTVLLRRFATHPVTPFKLLGGYKIRIGAFFKHGLCSSFLLFVYDIQFCQKMSF